MTSHSSTRQRTFFEVLKVTRKNGLQKCINQRRYTPVRREDSAYLEHIRVRREVCRDPQELYLVQVAQLVDPVPKSFAYRPPDEAPRKVPSDTIIERCAPR